MSDRLALREALASKNVEFSINQPENEDYHVKNEEQVNPVKDLIKIRDT